MDTISTEIDKFKAAIENQFAAYKDKELPEWARCSKHKDRIALAVFVYPDKDDVNVCMECGDKLWGNGDVSEIKEVRKG